MNYLPIKLNKLRKHYNYSQAYVAEKLGVDVVEYMNYENGNSMINYSQMKKLASLYHVSVKEIFINDENITLHEIETNTDELNTKFFMPENNIKNKIKGFIINHKIATIIIVILLVAIAVLSIILNNVSKPYTIYRENINRLSVSDETVLYIDDSGAIGFSGSNSNGQVNNLIVDNPIKVCEGEGFSVILNENGCVTSSGLISKYEKIIADWKNIIDIAAGNNHVVAVDSNGRVYCAGDDVPCEIEGTRNVKKVFATDNAAIALSEVGTLTIKGTLTGTSYLKDYLNIKDLASSDDILVVLNNDSSINVYSKYGSYIKAESWNDIVDITCGNDFVAGLDAFGKVHIEMENDEIKEKVNEWSNIIAIDAGKDYLIAFDGKNIFGVGKNSYNQFAKEEKQKKTLEKVSNISYSLDQEKIYVDFDGVNNANGYMVKINVGTGLSAHVDDVKTVDFLTENMIEGKTYTIGVIALGSSDYKDSDEEEISFVYNMPEKLTKIDIEKYIGKEAKELETYLTTLDISYKNEISENEICEGSSEYIVEISGLNNGEYSVDDLSTKMVKITSCKVE